MQKVEGDWGILLKDEFNKPYFKNLMNKIENEKLKHRVFPCDENVFNAFNLTPFYNVKVVIIGQDPYHEYGQAHGLSFSVQKGVKLPPSLRNIYKEISDEFNIEMSDCGDLTSWAKQGVLLLNSSLTVNEGMAASHKDFGWENFTKAVVQLVNDRLSEVVFLLWGRHAISYEEFINTNKHFVLKCPHPSPLSAHSGFFGCGHFIKTNNILKALGKPEIDWKN